MSPCLHSGSEKLQRMGAGGEGSKALWLYWEFWTLWGAWTIGFEKWP